MEWLGVKMKLESSKRKLQCRKNKGFEGYHQVYDVVRKKRQRAQFEVE
jgi:hypothetical protein